MRPTGSHVLVVMTVAASLALANHAGGLLAESLVLVAGLALINQARTTVAPVTVRPASPSLRQRYTSWREQRDDRQLTWDDHAEVAGWAGLRAEVQGSDWTRPIPVVREPAGNNDSTIMMPAITMPVIYGPELPEAGSRTERARAAARTGLDQYEASLPAYGRDAAG